MQTLPNLFLFQDRIDPKAGTVSAERAETWYIHDDYVAGVPCYDAAMFEDGRHGQKPIAKVSVILPDILFGGSEEIRTDIRDAVILHAEKYLH